MVWKWMQSTVTHDLIRGRRLPLQPLHSVTCSFQTKLIKQWETCWKLQGANGQRVPYIRYVQLNMHLCYCLAQCPSKHKVLLYHNKDSAVIMSAAKSSSGQLRPYVWHLMFDFEDSPFSEEWKVHITQNWTDWCVFTITALTVVMSQRSNTPSSSWVKCLSTLVSSLGEKISYTFIFCLCFH